MEIMKCALFHLPPDLLFAVLKQLLPRDYCRLIFQTNLSGQTHDQETIWKLWVENHLGVQNPGDLSWKTFYIHDFRTYKISQFWMISHLGQGAYGDVFRAKRKNNGSEIALKVLSKQNVIKHGIESVKNEKEALSITPVYGVPAWSQWYLHHLSLSNTLGELLKYLKTGMNPQCCAFVAAELLMAVEYLHKQAGIIHRDLKPENILVTQNWHILLADFGSCIQAPPEQPCSQLSRASFMGTIMYMAPELIKETKSCFASDLWAFGALVFYMVTCRLPFSAGSEYLTAAKIRNAELNPYPDMFCWPEAQDLISQLLVLEPANRIGTGAEGYQAIKQHSFFQEITWTGLGSQTSPLQILQNLFPVDLAEPSDLQKFSWLGLFN